MVKADENDAASALWQNVMLAMPFFIMLVRIWTIKKINKKRPSGPWQGNTIMSKYCRTGAGIAQLVECPN